MDEADAIELVQMLERRLLDPAGRADAGFLARTLSEDFVEFARSGAVYDKAATLAALAGESGPGAAMSAFSARMIAPGAMLTACRTRRADGSQPSLRSSIWRREAQGWRLVFRQATPLAD